MLIPRAEEEAIKWIALLTTLARLAVTTVVPRSASSTATSSRLQFDVNKHWIDVINSHYHVAVDGISLPMLAAVGVHHACCASSTRGTTSPSRTTPRRSSR